MVYFPVDIEKAIARECKRRGYSERTLKTYLYSINKFLKFTDKPINKISKRDARLFLEYLSENEKAGNTMNTYHMAIKFLFQDVLDKKMQINIRYSKIPETLPIALTKDEVKLMINSINNPKHKLMIQMMYSAGLRVSELLNLKIKDLKIDEGYGWVRKGKGKKDRLFIIADSLKKDLKNFICLKKINEYDYLFTSVKGKQYSIRSPQQIVRGARSNANINKRVTCHTLRHSFATHLIENGYSISEVQSLLGHKSPETTFVYVHATSPRLIKVKSPLDEI